MGTPFVTVYNRFLGKITDDMYVELTPEDTRKDIQNLLIEAIPGFEFPRKNLDNYIIDTKVVYQSEVGEDDFVIKSLDEDSDNPMVVIENSKFSEDLTSEEINILSYIMVEGWLQRQISSIEHTRMKFSGSDFKFTSQANHLQKLLTTQENVRTRNHHLQRLYKRRKKEDENSAYESNWSVLNKSVFD